MYQYAVVNRPGASPLVIGSKNKPSTITLAGTGEVYHRVYNDNANWPLNLYDNAITTGTLKFIAIKVSVDATLCVADNELSGNNCTIPLEADVWTFISGGSVLGYAASVNTRLTEAAVDIDYVSLYAGANADIEFFAMY